jgi:gliding motility-associated-like protein
MRILPNLTYPLSVFSRLTLLFVWIILIPAEVHAQCNTTLEKLLAEKSVNNDDRFGSSLAANGRYMVVGAENSDTLGILYAGAAFVYEKTAAGWAYRAMLTPTDPDEYKFFSNDLTIDDAGNTIVVADRGYPKGGVYIYEKPASGWASMTETVKITLPDYLEFSAAIDISDDGSEIAVTGTQWTNTDFYVLDRQGPNWTNSVVPQVVAGPSTNDGMAFGMDILIQDDYIYATADFGMSGIYVFKRNGIAFDFIAKLSTTVPFGQMGYFGRHLTVHGDLIATTGAVSAIEDPGEKVFVFKKNGEWTDATELAKVHMPNTRNGHFPIQFISSTEIAASIFYKEEGEEYYTGKLQIVTAVDPSWQNVTSEVIYQQDRLDSFAEFDGELVWNGTDLIRSIGAIEVGLARRFAVVSLTRNFPAWGSLQHVTLSRNSSSNVNFGSAIIRTSDALFAGSPFDGTAGRGAGAVYVYEKSGDEFVKTHTILPTARKVRPTGGSDEGFGYSLATYQDELAIGAPIYRNSAVHYGKIFLYRRTGASWTTATLYDSLIAPEELVLNHVGSTLAMNDRYLFASAYNNFNDEHTNAIVVFEKISGKWTFQEVLKPSRPIDKSWPSIKLSLYGDQLAVGSYFSMEGGVSILTKNPATGKWETQVSLNAGIFSGFGADLKLQANHLFVGVPEYNHKGVLRSGAVVVYTKLPGQTWTSLMQPSAVIGAKEPIEGGYFGTSIDVVGNTLVVGAPGKFLTNDAQVRTVPGNSYVIQAQNYNWTNNLQFLVLQGDRYASEERDHFGSDVGVDEEYFYIGARSENSSTGMFSGAVYYIPTPPVIFLLPPVCAGGGIKQLQAYPFGGTWSGPGIEDPSGTFNPALAAAGINALTYTTPNCNFEGTIEIEIKNPDPLDLLTPADVTICSEKVVTLKVESGLTTSLQWFYKPEGSSTFVLLGQGGPSREVTNPGQYFASTAALECPGESPVFTVQIEGFPVTVGPQDVICSLDKMVDLKVSVGSGFWEGPNINGRYFNPAGAENGIYRLTYRIVTPMGCSLALKDSVRINAIRPFTISRIPGDYCETGAATLKADAAASLNYTWYFSATSATELLPIDKPLGADATVYEQGFYSASAANADCTGESNTVSVGFENDLTYTMAPDQTPVMVCEADDFLISVQSREGAEYSWAFKAPDSDAYQNVLEGSSQLTVHENGSYRVSGRYGFCSFESQPISVEFSNDVFFVPNVFTPNGDTRNEIFTVDTTYDVIELKIFNRYGKEIHTSSNGVWNGANTPSGVYYWIVKYVDCVHLERTAKGSVHLLTE